jgi:hypothetical protein
MPRNTVVDEFMKKLDHPLMTELELVRNVILGASDKIEEDIKWSSPTFMYQGNLASIVVRTKKRIQLLFHSGAGLPNPDGLLEGEGATVRYANFNDLADIKRRQKALEAVVKAWVKSR